MRLAGASGPNTIEIQRTQFAAVGGWALTDVPGGRDALAEMVAPELRDLVDGLVPESAPAVSFVQGSTGWGRSQLEIWATGVRIHAADGSACGHRVALQARGGHGDARSGRGDGRSRALRADAGRRAARPATGGDPVRRPRGFVQPRASPVDRRLLRRRPPVRGGCRPVHRGRRRPGRPARRRRRGRLLPRRDRGVGVGGGASLHRRGPRSATRDGRRGGAQRAGAPTTLSCASGCTGGRPPTSGGSRRPGAAR